MFYRPNCLSFATTLALAATAFHSHAATSDTTEEESRLPAVVVSALGISEEEAQVATPVSLIDGDALLKKGEGSLGDALDGLPGVHSDSFGGGASRPVIRGQGAPRVKILSDGISVLDASDISPDHAISADPLLLQRVEVLRGPATLLYGSGAVGGAVNLLDNKIPEEQPVNGLEGLVALRANSVANERAGAAAVTSSVNSTLAAHAELSYRHADDYRIPRGENRRVEGSFAESGNASLGLSWIGDYGYAGLAYSVDRKDYGLPGHEHDNMHCHPHGATLHCDDHDHGGEDEHEHDDVPSIDLRSERIDLRAESEDPFVGIRRIRFRASHTDYRHDELDDGQVSTTFGNRGQEGRLEIEHLPLGAWSGIVGIQHADTRSTTSGIEAFLPHVATRSTGLFLVEHWHISEQWHVELGGRHESLQHRPKDDPRSRPSFRDTAQSFSGSAVWSFAPDYSASLSFTRSERLPHAQELYASGIHLATNTYECGLLPDEFTCGGSENDAELATEASRNLELSLRRNEGSVRFEIGAYLNKVANHVHARTLDQHEEFRLIKYTQRDTRFHGIEAQISWDVSEQLRTTAFGDRVRASFTEDGQYLPRIPAARAGLRLNAELGVLNTEVEYYRVFEQRRIADYETITPGHTMLNLSFDYRFGDDGQSSVFLRGSNLLNQTAWSHTSFLADRVPQPGRNISLGLQRRF